MAVKQNTDLYLGKKSITNATSSRYFANFQPGLPGAKLGVFLDSIIETSSTTKTERTPIISPAYHLYNEAQSRRTNFNFI